MKTDNLTIKQFGNGLRVRLLVTVAKEAKLEANHPMQVIAKEGCIIINPMGARKPSLAEKLARFDSIRHGGEVMGTCKVDTVVL